jgi:hypothetical protein
MLKDHPYPQARARPAVPPRRLRTGCSRRGVTGCSARGKAECERLDILGTRFDHKLIDVLVADAKVRDALHIVDVADHERALVWKDGRFAYILGPGPARPVAQPVRACTSSCATSPSRASTTPAWRRSWPTRREEVDRRDRRITRSRPFCSSATASWSARWPRAATPSGRARVSSRGRRSTCVSRSPTWPARRS